MKKFLADNITWLVLIALVLAGFAVWKLMKADGKTNSLKPNSTSDNTDKEKPIKHYEQKRLHHHELQKKFIQQIRRPDLRS